MTKRALQTATSPSETRSVSVTDPHHPHLPIFATRNLKVAVLVDLEWSAKAGGHVKCWERFAESTRGLGDKLDLTIYFLGTREETIDITPHARFVLLPASFHSSKIPFVKQGAGETDLGKYHKRLAELLPSYDLFHITDTFCFARTAMKVAEKMGKPVTSSIHTDLPEFTDVYTREVIQNMMGTGWLSKLFLETLQIHKKSRQKMQMRVDEVCQNSRHIFVSKQDDQSRVSGMVGTDRVSFLRRGIDKSLFSPQHRDKQRLITEFSLPEDEDLPIILFAGRVDASKKAATVIEAARQLLDKGRKFHLLMVGQGSQTHHARRQLGPNVTLPGVIPQDTLAWVYASCDVFAFPSESEVIPNVVLEAKASGLPIMVADHPGGRQYVNNPNQDGIIVDHPSAAAWAKAMDPFIIDPVYRAKMAYHARMDVENNRPTWEQVVEEDLLPIWLAHSGKRG